MGYRRNLRKSTRVLDGQIPSNALSNDFHIRHRFNLELGRQSYPVQQLIESGIGAKRIPDWINFEIDDAPIALFNSLVEPKERTVVTPETGVGERHQKYWEIVMNLGIFL